MTCENCKEVLSRKLCDLPIQWRDQIVNTICTSIEQREKLDCEDVKDCETVTTLSDFTINNNEICISFTDENGVTTERCFDINDVDILNNTFIDNLFSNPEFIENFYDNVGNMFIDTNTIDHTFDDLNNTVYSDVIISQKPFNGISAEDDGIYDPDMPESGIVYGGEVTWTGIGYIYDIEATGYFINGVFYESPATTVTLDPADPTFNRLDSFLVDTTSVATRRTGIASDNPAEPPIDIETELRLGSALVVANTTEPLTDQCIYQENAEWTASPSSATIDPSSTASPCSGTFNIEGANVLNGDNILFTNPLGSFPPKAYTVLSFNISPVAPWQGSQLVIQWELAGVPVGSPVTIGNTMYGFDELGANCQTINIPLNDFIGLTFGSIADSIRITATVPTTFTGFRIDNFCLTITNTIPTNNTTLIFNNGLTRTGNVVQFGGFLLHNTELFTGYFKQTFSGTTIYDYPYDFKQYVDFANSTGIASFQSAGNTIVSEPDYQNKVRLGINYTGAIYPSTPSNLTGYMNDKIGYWMGPNITGNGSFGLRTDDPDSKYSGIFWHTLDSTYTDLITFFGKAAPNTNYQASIATPGGTLENDRIMTMHSTLDIQLWNYPNTRNDGTSQKFLTTDIDGNVKLMEIDSSGVEITLTADNGLHKNTPTNVRWGGTLLEDTIIIDDGFVPTFYNDTSTDTLDVTNVSSGVGVSASSISGAAVLAISTSGNGVQAYSDSAAALYASSIGNYAGNFNIAAITTNTIHDILLLRRGSSGSPTTGLGLGIAMELQTDSTVREANRINSKWTTATDATRTSALEVWGTGAGTIAKLLTFANKGITSEVRFEFRHSDATTAAANNLTLPYDGNGHTISGNTQINAITATDWQKGSQIILIFTGAPLLKHNTVGGGGTLPMKLAGSADFQAAADDAILFESDGSFWHEIGRKVAAAGPTITADNALTKNTATNVQWGSDNTTGSPLLHHTYVNANGFSTYFREPGDAGVPTVQISTENTTETALYVTGHSVNNLSGLGFFYNSSGSNAGTTLYVAQSSLGGLPSLPALRIDVSSNTSPACPVILELGSNASAATDGNGGVIAFKSPTTLVNTNNSASTTHQLISRWDKINHTTRTSEFLLYGFTQAKGTPHLHIGGYEDLTESTATTFFQADIPSIVGETSLGGNGIAGGWCVLTVESTDTTDYQCRTLKFIWAAVKFHGAITVNISTPEEVYAATAGTLAVTITAVDAGDNNTINFKADAVSSLTQSRLKATWQFGKNL